MAMPHYSPDFEAFKANSLYRAVEAEHGDLTELIPQAINEPGATLESVGKRFGVSSTWVATCLKALGYSARYVWMKQEVKQ